MSFDAQGGTTPSPASKTVINHTAYGTLATTTRTGYTFGGWFPDSGGTGTQVTSATIVNTTASHSLYAKWTPAPEIAVEQPLGTNIVDGSSKSFGSVSVGSSANLTFTIKNVGSANLTGLTISKDGANPADFTVTSSPVAPVVGGSSTTFTVTFAPGAAGARNAAIHIASNDADENPFDFNLNGTGLTALQSWRQTNFGSPDNSGDGADLSDFDGDGIPSIIEFAFLLNPKQSSAGMLPQWQMIGGNFVMSFTQDASVSGITYGAEWSTTLLPGSWTAIPDTGTPPQHTFSLAMGLNTKLFMRLIINQATNPTPAGMALIPAGSFTMGDALDGISNAPLHTVNVSGFYIEKNLVTKAQWDEVRAWGLNNGYTDLPAGAGKATNHPVQTITWYAVAKWCNARSEKEGLTPCYTVGDVVYKTGSSAPVLNMSVSGYRLPTEAEWEKAARGGVSGRRFPWGDTISRSQANYYGATGSYTYDLGPNGYNPTYATGGYPYTSPVGSFAANEYGLYDMAGNVLEWCWDWYDTYASGSVTDPTGPASGSYRVFRGGYWGSYASGCRVAGRGNYDPSDGFSGFGFRSARSSVP